MCPDQKERKEEDSFFGWTTSFFRLDLVAKYGKPATDRDGKASGTKQQRAGLRTDEDEGDQ